MNQKSDFMFLFHKTIRALYLVSKAREHNSLSYLFLLIPYINVYKNILCNDVDCDDIEKAKPLHLVDIAKLLDYKNTDELKNILYSIKIDNHYMVSKMSFCNDRVHFWCVNPKIYHSPKFNSSETIKDYFNIANNIVENGGGIMRDEHEGKCQ